MKKVALITGAAARIGAGIAVGLSKAGYDIALHYNNSKDEAAEIKNKIEGFGSKCELFNFDFSNPDKNISLIKVVFDSFSRIDLLVNNASIFIKSKIIETDTELFDKTFNINLKTPFFLIKEFARICKKGNIINILDAKISKNEFNYSIYVLTKKCLADLTLLSAKEFGPEIRVNGISPGIILPPKGEGEEYLLKKISKLPLARKGEIADINQAIDFIIKNEYLTGQIIYIDGGEHL
jgi:pteridine reductase